VGERPGRIRYYLRFIGRPDLDSMDFRSIEPYQVGDELRGRMLATKATRPHWYRARILGEWGSFEGAAYEEFEEGVHVVRPFDVPEHWSRFESLDFGANNPTAYLVWAADEEGNLVVADEYYAPGLA
jgi:hypothetical protein